MGRIAGIILFLGLVGAWLCFPGLAWADPAGSDNLGFDEGLGDVPPEDIVGWFLTFDPSNQWTSAANIATMESWLAAAEEIAAGNSAALNQLYDLGLSDPEAAEVYQVVTSDSPDQDDFSPEPATLGLLGGGLAVLGLYTARQVRRIAAGSPYG